MTTVIREVRLTRHVLKQIEKLPHHIVDKLDVWISDVERRGLEEVRKISGFHDEPLKGQRVGQRFIRSQ